MKRRPVNAAEFVAQLEADPEYQARMRKREAELAPIWERRRKDEAPLVQELRQAGFQIESVFDFVNTAQEYRSALPILIRHLEIPHEPWIREGIIRSLTIKYGGLEVEEALLRQFYAEPDIQVRWVLANALNAAMPLIRRKKHPEIKAVYERSKRPNPERFVSAQPETGRLVKPATTANAHHPSFYEHDNPAPPSACRSR